LWISAVPVSSTDEGIVGVRFDDGGLGSNIVTLTFTNLDPARRYVFRGTAVRGNNYVDRWALYTLRGAASFVDAHVVDPGTNNLLTAATFPTAGLGPGQVAINSGENRAGSLVGWDAIDPGSDGIISIEQVQYTGPAPYGNPAGGPYGYTMNAIMLLEIGPPSPASILTQPAAQVTVIEQQTITLSVRATGGPVPSYQWNKVGTGPIAGATKPTLTITNSVLGDAGEYYVVVTNPQNSIESSHSQVTVLPDTFPPKLLSVTAHVGGTNVLLVFDEPLDPTSAADGFIYSINGAGPAQVIIENPTTVSLLPASPLQTCVLNTLSIMGLLDTTAAQNSLTTKLSFTASLLLMAPGDTGVWRYDQNGVDLGDAWRAPGYDDNAWASGMQLFDAKSPAARTMLPNGVVVVTQLSLTNSTTFPASDIPTYYLRTHFDLPTSPQSVTRLHGRLLVDDGVVFYLNGTEIYRQGVTNGTPFDVYGNGGVGDADYQAIVLPTSALVQGDNVLAAELKNNAATSSDITLGLELMADISQCGATPPRLSISQNGNQITITWSAANGVLERTTSLPGGWGDVTGATSPYTVTASDAAAFYRLRTP
jgi:hypothetical protein